MRSPTTILFAAALLSIPVASVFGASPPPGYELVWADEFNVDGPPDPKNWTFERGFERNHELQFYQPDNAWVKDGVLVIEARREEVPNPRHEPGSNDWTRTPAKSTFTSASILTRGLREWTYGRFEMRGRIDVRQGLWPAWWTLGVEREWPHNGEIDIMEFYRGKLLARTSAGKRSGTPSPRRWRS